MEQNNYNPNEYAVAPTGTQQCGCARCRCRGLTGPAVLITLGVLFTLSELNIARFHNTWPILLIVIGLIKVLGSNADTSGHIDVNAPPAAPGTTGPGAPPPTSGPGQVGNV
jgi:hypothetical protein